MANATRATIARPSLFFTVLLRVQLSLCAMLSFLLARLANTYRLVGMYYALYVTPVKAFPGSKAGFPYLGSYPNPNRAPESASVYAGCPTPRSYADQGATRRYIL